MAYVQATINSTDPVGGEAVNLGASRIRNLAAAVKERLASAFVAPDTDPMVLKPGSLPVVTAGWSIAGGFTVSTGNITATVGQFNGSGAGLTGVPASSLTGTLPAVSGANLTNLNASNLGSGTVPGARLPTAYTPQITFFGGLAFPNGGGSSINNPIEANCTDAAASKTLALIGRNYVYTGAVTPPAMTNTPTASAAWKYIRVQYNDGSFTKDAYIPVLVDP